MTCSLGKLTGKNRPQRQPVALSSLLSRLRVLSPAKRFVSLTYAWFLSAVLLFGQGVEITHSHDGDLQQRFDCEICVVTGALGQALSSSVLTLEFERPAVDSELVSETLVSTTRAIQRARAPPFA
ncbi:hypothetical protein N9Z60_05155 [Gammaproteobacteria bacterium]|nr:hypothetical protein [Gammaproteobacteria bacterium]